ncbi:MAG: ergothioneine biosynthesis protein EgtB [Xanthomonadales bacterium]|nr:ergothioneine biosynthesis protein EgtB [Xanthomonadales bacterium]
MTVHTGQPPAPELDAVALAARFRAIRAASTALVAGLDAEDLVPQSMPDASPGKWHLAHTTWFFEAMVLMPLAGQPPADRRWHYLFNSYYEALGPRQPRPQRGLLTRPSLAEVLAWRADVEDRVLALLAAGPPPGAAELLALGCQHEQQHQELLVTDLKHLFAQNALAPCWRGPAPPIGGNQAPMTGWHRHDAEGPAAVGAGQDGFAFDNERPRHTVWLRPFELADRPVSTGEWLAFIDDGGYSDPALWLADGWAAVQAGDWQAPLYWHRPAPDAPWRQFTVWGWRDLDPAEPVCHLSCYEADAYARWAGARLPSEAEWEAIAARQGLDGGFADAGRLHPAPLHGPSLGGEVWEWTASAYAPYPGFRPLPGAAGEYNGKFMSGQRVLRGGSCASPRDHLRTSYRNFFPPAARWQFSGLRLARDL